VEVSRSGTPQENPIKKETSIRGEKNSRQRVEVILLEIVIIVLRE
jgi:hypothetical protein